MHLVLLIALTYPHTLAIIPIYANTYDYGDTIHAMQSILLL